MRGQGLRMNYQTRQFRPRLARTPAAQAVRLPLAPSREQRRIQAYLGLVLLDGLMLVAAFVLADFAYTQGRQYAQGLVVAQLVMPLYWTAAIGFQAYSVSALVSRSFRRQQVTLAVIVAATLLTLVAFALKNSGSFSRVGTTIGFVLAVVLLNLARRAVEPLVQRLVGPTASNVLVIDDGGDPIRVPHAYHVDSREHGLSPDLNDPHMLDRIGLYMANMDRVIVSCAVQHRQDWAMIFKSANVQGEIVDREVLSLGVIGARRGHLYGYMVR
jgi:hypothetical protein